MDLVLVDGEHGLLHHYYLVLVDRVDEMMVVCLVVLNDFVLAESVFFLLKWLDKP